VRPSSKQSPAEQGANLSKMDGTAPSNEESTKEETKKELEQNQENKEPTKSPSKKFPSFSRQSIPKFFHQIPSFIKREDVRRTFKSSLIFFISTLVSWIIPVSRTLGPLNFLGPVAVLLSDTNKSVGGAVEAFFWLTIAICSAIACGIFVLEVYNGSEFGIVCLFFIIMFIYSWFQAKYPIRGTVPAVLARLVVVLFVIRPAIGSSWDWPFVFDASLPILIGGAIALVFTILILPRTAFYSLNKEINTTLLNLSKHFRLCNELFLDKEVNALEYSKRMTELETALMKNLSSISTHFREARIEFSISKIAPKHYHFMTISLRKLIQYSRSMSALKDFQFKNSDILSNVVKVLTTPMNELTSLCCECLDQMRTEMNSSRPQFGKTRANEIPSLLEKFDSSQQKAIGDLFSIKIEEQNDARWEELFQVFATTKQKHFFPFFPFFFTHTFPSFLLFFFEKAYFFVFSYREFVMELHSLLLYLQSAKTGKYRIHVPLQPFWRDLSKKQSHSKRSSQPNSMLKTHFIL
jgi:hypothetical protein